MLSLDVSALASRLQRAAADLPRALDGAVGEAADLVRARARANAPVDTGRLRDSIEVSKPREGERHVTSNAPHALRRELGYSGTDAAGRTVNETGDFYATRAAAESEGDLARAAADAVTAALGGTGAL